MPQSGTIIRCAAQGCSVTFPAKSSHHAYCCDECRDKEMSRKKRDEAKAPIGSEISCEECLKPLIKKSSTQTMHPECSRARVRRRNKIYKLRHKMNKSAPAKSQSVIAGYETRRVSDNLWPTRSGIHNISTADPVYCPFWTNEVKVIRI